MVLPLHTICSEDSITPELFLNISTHARGGVQNTDRFEHVVKLLALLKGHKGGRQYIFDVLRIDSSIISPCDGVRTHKNYWLTCDDLGRKLGQEASRN